MKKLIACLLIMAMLLTFMPLGTVYAGANDIYQVFLKLNSLTSTQKSALLEKLWDLTVEELNDDIPVTVDEIFAEMESELRSIAYADTNMWEAIVGEGEGKLSETAIRQMIDVSLQHKGIVVTVHDNLAVIVDKPYIKEKLGLPINADEYAVYQALLAKTDKIITSSGNQFVRYGNVGERLITSLGLQDLEQLFPDLEGFINTQMDSIVNEINNYITQYGLDRNNVILALTLYGLYHDPSSTPAPGGSGPAPTPTPSPSPTPDALETIKEELSKPVDPENAAKLLNNASNIIDEIEDPEEAVNVAAELISAAGQSTDTSDADVEQALLNIAQAALSKINTYTVEAQMSDDAGVVTLNDAAIEQLLSIIEEIAEKTAELNSKLEESGVTEGVPAVLNINVSSEEAVDEVTVEIPGNILNAAEENGLDIVAVNTGVATISKPSGALEVEEDSKVSVSAKKVDAAELPAEIGEVVGNNPVFDFEITVDGEKVTSFGKYIEVSIPYELKPGENPDTITVFYLRENTDTEDPDDYILENVIGVYDPETKTVKFTTIHFSTYVVKQNAVTFSDVVETTRFREYIEAMAAKGIVVGYDGKYRPGATFTRAEVCAIVVKTLKLYDEEATCDFDDVKESDWFYKHVASAYKAGIISGRPGNIFDPYARMTRQEVATIVSNALIKIKGKAEIKDADRYLSQFTDSHSILPYAKAPVALMAKYSIMGPKFGKSFRPDSPVTRGEAAQVFYNLLNVN